MLSKNLPIFIAVIIFFVPATVISARLGDMVFDDKIESLKKAGVNPPVFPHGRHEDIYKCDDCHPKIFKDKRGANDNISMQQIIKGKLCGAPDCHNSPKTFPLFQCKKCHLEKK